MHILFIPSWYPENSRDIAGCFFREQAIALARAGHKVGVLSFFGRPQLFKKPRLWGGGLSVENDRNVQTWRVYHAGGIPWVGPVIKPLLAARFFQMYCAENGKPDLLHAHSAIGVGGFAGLLSRISGVPYVITEHSSAFPCKLLPYPSKVFAKRAFEKASLVMAVSTALANSVTETCKISGRISVVPNFLNQTIFGNDDLVIRSRGQGFTFLNVGMLSKNKGQDYLIVAFAKQFRGRPVELLIGGYGQKRSSLEGLIRSLGMDRQVRLLGRLSREEVRDQMMKCDAFVLSSWYETFGVVLIEALACGKPIVATKCGGPEDIVNDTNGILVARGSVEQLAYGMETIYQSVNRFDPIKIYESCLRKFGEKVIIEQLTDIYKFVLSRSQIEK